jgi:hypothetical protein
VEEEERGDAGTVQFNVKLCSRRARLGRAEASSFFLLHVMCHVEDLLLT